MKSFKSVARESFKLMNKDKKTVFFFTLIYTGLAGFIIAPLAVFLFSKSLFVNNLYYLGGDTIVSYLLSPLTWIFLVALFLVFTYLQLIQIGGYSHVYSSLYQDKKLKFTEIVAGGVLPFKKLAKPKNWLIIPFAILLFPFTGFMSATSVGFSISVPGFIMDVIKKNPLFLVLFVVFYLVLMCVALRYIFSFWVFSFDSEVSFGEACRDSKSLMKGRLLKTFVYLILWYLIYLAIAITITLAIFFGSYAVSALLGGEASKVSSICVGVCVYLFSLGIPVWTYSFISVLFFNLSEEEKKERIHREYRFGKTSGIVFVVILVLLVVFSAYEYSFFPEISVVSGKRPEIMAHRGDSVRAPENSLPAFDLATKEEDVTWIELDIHQTKDGKIIISHDDNLKRICGQSIYVYDKTYEELQELEVGSWFSEEFRGLKLATLDEAFDLLKGKVKIQVEIKPTKADDHIEEAVIDIIRSHDMVDDVVVLSISDAPLRRIKEIAPDITTMYCMPLALGFVENIPFADLLSIEESNISASLVASAHEIGKQCFVWTINDPENVQHLVDIGVDGILTDDPIMMKEALDDCDYDMGALRTLRFLIGF